jgi:thymidylate synthase (FAD)
VNAKLIWATPNIDGQLAYIARVSNPDGQDKPVAGLLRYMVKHGHWSPFEMASVCIEINTTRDIARQILRHKSFGFQELSQRYQDVTKFDLPILRECRRQDNANRQNSFETRDTELVEWWEDAQHHVREKAFALYREALALGIAKEQARALLPEGLTPSRMYVSGTMRSWMTYLKQRLDLTTQKEHRIIAQQCSEILENVAPQTMQALRSEK